MLVNCRFLFTFLYFPIPSLTFPSLLPLFSFFSFTFPFVFCFPSLIPFPSNHFHSFLFPFSYFALRSPHKKGENTSRTSNVETFIVYFKTFCNFVLLQKLACHAETMGHPTITQPFCSKLQNIITTHITSYLNYVKYFQFGKAYIFQSISFTIKII